MGLSCKFHNVSVSDKNMVKLRKNWLRCPLKESRYNRKVKYGITPIQRVVL